MIRPTERRAVAELLSEPADDAEELAGRIITALDGLRGQRPFAVVVTQVDGQPAVTWGNGPYSTEQQARKSVEKGTVPVVSGSRAMVFTVYPVPGPETHKSFRCDECRHPTIQHNWPKSKIIGCVVTDCACERNGR